MTQDFPHVTILGGGLLGGSLALALHARNCQPRLWARRKETAEAARNSGIPLAGCDLAEAVRDADLLVLSVPVGAMAELVRQAVAAGLPAHCLITDVGSVKQLPHQSIKDHLAGRPFIGSHPMAGSEQAGIQAASATLFEGAACLLTNDDGIEEAITKRLECFWQGVGCHTTWMNAAAHDALVARISHLPHIVAAAAARVCLESPAESAFGGGGLRDTTRVAAGNPSMWAEILTENRQSILGPLQQTVTELNEIISLLESSDQEATRQWLSAAKDRRDLLGPSS